MLQRKVLLTVAALLSACVGFAQQWPRFRGPNGSGISESTFRLPQVWDQNVYRWTLPLPGTGHSSPVVWNEKVFVTSSTKSNASITLLCVSAGRGTLLWEKHLASKPHRMNPDNNYAASTPCVDSKRLYLMWSYPEALMVACCDHAGKELWRRNLGPFESLHGGGASPILWEDLLLVPNDQKGTSCLFALDCATGKTRWKIPRKSSSTAYSTPCVWRPKGSPPQIIFACTSHGLTGVDPRRGTVLWEFSDAFPLRVVSSPIPAAGLIVGTCGQGGRGKRLVAVRPPRSSEPPQLAYELTKDVPYVPTALASDRFLFLLTDRGTCSCVEATTGKVLWQEKLPARFYSSLVRVGQHLLALSRKGELFILSARPPFGLLRKISLGEGSHATPAVAGARLYLRTFSRLLCVELHS